MNLPENSDSWKLAARKKIGTGWKPAGKKFGNCLENYFGKKLRLTDFEPILFFYTVLCFHTVPVVPTQH
jgi:hypothetical protein